MNLEPVQKHILERQEVIDLCDDMSPNMRALWEQHVNDNRGVEDPVFQKWRDRENRVEPLDLTLDSRPNGENKVEDEVELLDLTLESGPNGENKDEDEDEDEVEQLEPTPEFKAKYWTRVEDPETRIKIVAVVCLWSVYIAIRIIFGI